MQMDLLMPHRQGKMFVRRATRHRIMGIVVVLERSFTALHCKSQPRDDHPQQEALAHTKCNYFARTLSRCTSPPNYLSSALAPIHTFFQCGQHMLGLYPLFCPRGLRFCEFIMHRHRKWIFLVLFKKKKIL